MKGILKTSLSLSILSFIFPVLILSIVFVMFKIYPYGNNIALTTDLYFQYIHYYSYLLEAIKGNDSLLYSWNAGLGSNFIGNIAYYTASPLLVILFIFPKGLFPEAVLLIILTKIGLCGVTISFFMTKRFKTLKFYEVVLFSSFYALMSYNLSYYYNVMWLDGVILLPLLVLSVDSILRNKSLIPYIFLQSLSFIANFYIAYMLGLFIFFYFIIDLFGQRKLKSTEQIKAIILKFLKGTFISIGISSFLMVPTFFQLLQSLGSFGNFSSGQDNNFLFKFLIGEYDSVRMGSPNIYIGSFILLLVPAFFISKINRFEKMKWGILLIIMAISFVIPPLNLFWQAGDEPNWFPFRYSFIFSFILFYISVAAYEKVHSIRFRVFLLLLFINVFILTAAALANNGVYSLVINIAFISLFSIILYIKKFNLKGLGFLIFFLFTSVELLFNSTVIISNIYKELGRPNRAQYTIYNDYKAAINQIKKTDLTPYYRVESNLNKTNNDSLTLGLGSLGHSSSMVNNDLIRTISSLGFYARKANYNKKGSTILTDSILGLKYFISSNEMDKEGFELISRMKKLYIYKNINSLPIGYQIREDVTNIQIDHYKNPFKLQNKIYETIFHSKDPLFIPISPEKVEYQNATFKELENGKQFTRIKKEKDIKIKYTFNIKDEANFYALFDLMDIQNILTNPENIKMTINNKEIGDYLKTQFMGIFEVGKFRNEQVVIELNLNKDHVKFASDLFYITNSKDFNNNLNSIDRNSFIMTHKEENTMEANINIKQDNQLLFLSIPWDEGWRVAIDGETVKPIKVFGSFMGIPLNKGEYHLQMTFIPKGFILGSFITLMSLLIFLKIFLVEYFKEKRVLKNVEEIRS
ncbi:YfhO family protein [Neobacillus sp. WH10]|uniref:YfhO family protein n=1 Tax=Neobacillus sp. WH10 TaxID=3047873 RepID=UPI0024C1AE96|nr:YfhO family protein [Neobacillus sp. WH10]WHY76788.1 YfhO family protein [Neobacillus sp. WH10]